MTILSLAFALNAYAGDDPQAKPKTVTDEVVFRAPFTLKLHIDKENYYEASYDKIPYVHNGDIYLFPGESFGADVDIKDNKIVSLKYQKDPQKADIALRFTQEIKEDGSQIMILKIESKLKQKLYLDAKTAIPGKKGIFKTSILPVEPGLIGYESWPHPIVQLVLTNLRLNK
ncbi:MAG: hypothetical protein Q8O30_02795 [Candidatus Omnitrophota bacterium]|nr:hypothetical protein [Candidatus Omnitrophota bacterium]